ncbi:hypothetical protein IJG14_05285 [bacterium]|nr:hypothetical protein [bacterium]
MIIKSFVLLSILLFISLLSGKLYFYNHKNRFIKERSVMIGAYLLFLYIVSAIISIFYVDEYEKMVMFICAIAPFIIGHYATYKRLYFYTILQLIFILFGLIILVIPK